MADARRAYLIDENDTVAVALCSLHGGEDVTVGGHTVRVAEDIPPGHKLAVRTIAAGEHRRRSARAHTQYVHGACGDTALYLYACHP